jgi:hypothetical protein
MKHNERLFTKTIIQEDGDTTYIANGPTTGSESNAVWQVVRITVDGDTTIKIYANGDPAFNNIITDMSSLDFGD